MTVTKLKQKYDKLRNNYSKKVLGESGVGGGGAEATSDIESDDSSTSENSHNLIKFFESKYNRMSLLSLLNEGPKHLSNQGGNNANDGGILKKEHDASGNNLTSKQPQTDLTEVKHENDDLHGEGNTSPIPTSASPLQILPGGGSTSGDEYNTMMDIDQEEEAMDNNSCGSSSASLDPESDDLLFCGHHVEKYLSSEFDGSQVLCRVCGDKASGFHYGVHSCEGCKGFFRRSIQQKIQYRPCTKNQQCSILRVNRNRCQYCRLKKCISVGMSRDAVRFGRVPKREKAKIMAAMQMSHNAKANERALSQELEDISKLTNSIILAHMETCEFTIEKVQTRYQNALLKKQQEAKQGCGRFGASQPSTISVCPLNPETSTEDFSERFSPAIRGVVEFAKRLPGFSLLSQDDQVTLLKAGVFEILLVRLACMFKGNTMLCLNGDILERETVSAHQNARFLLDSMFKFAEHFNSLRLTDEQIGLFCAMVILAHDRPGLRNVELVQKLQSHSRSALQGVLPAYMVQELDKKIPDLRTLNTLHSEKLLAFKVEEQNQIAETQRMQHSPVSIASSHRSSSSVDSLDSFHNSNSTLSHGSSCHDNDLPIPGSRRLSTTSTCPYKFPRALESPSGDSGIESGACSSPARSEQDIPILPPTPSSSQDDMPVLKRALQAPPMVDTNSVMNNAYRPHKKFRYSASEKSLSNAGSPPPMASQPSPAPATTYPQTYAQRGTPMTGPTPPPQQVYPQLAAALTQPPRLSNNNCPSGGLIKPFKSPLQIQHSTLMRSLNEKPKQLTESHAVNSELLHSIIMRNGSDGEGQDRIYQQHEDAPTSDNQVPLNLSTKIQIC